MARWVYTIDWVSHPLPVMYVLHASVSDYTGTWWMIIDHFTLRSLYVHSNPWNKEILSKQQQSLLSNVLSWQSFGRSEFQVSCRRVIKSLFAPSLFWMVLTGNYWFISFSFLLQGNNLTSILAFRADQGPEIEEEGHRVRTGSTTATVAQLPFSGNDDKLRFVTFEEIFQCASDDELHQEIRVKYVDLMIG